MDFEEALYNFTREVYKKFGIDDGITQISLSPELYNCVMRTFMEKHRYLPADINGSTVNGISLKVRIKADL